MNSDLELFTHRWVDQGSSQVLVLFHGTGADENDLIPLAQSIAPGMSLLSLRGNTQEHGMNRFFHRYPEGTFDEESVDHETQKLKRFLAAWLDAKGKAFSDLVFLGYSNGATFALSFLLSFPNTVHKAVLFHNALPFSPKKNIDLSSAQVLLTSGEHDPYMPADKQELLRKALEQTKAQTTWLQHSGGHELRREELLAARDFLAQA